MTTWPQINTKFLTPGIMKFNFGRTYLGHQYYNLSLSDLCPEKEKTD